MRGLTDEEREFLWMLERARWYVGDDWENCTDSEERIGAALLRDNRIVVDARTRAFITELGLLALRVDSARRAAGL